MEDRPTTGMKKGWLYRTSCDKRNWDIATFWDSTDDDYPDLMMIQIKWWSRCDDDPDLMMIHIWWWYNDDDPAVVMVQIPWWRRLEEEDDLEDDLKMKKTKKMKKTWRRWWLEDEEDLKMKTTWRWRWRDDPVDTEKKTWSWKLCRKNTFLVKRECWCICNFGMYSLIYLMSCTPMFIPGCVYNVIESCHAPMFW